RALRTDVETLLAEDVDEDVVIRPTPTREHGRTTWMLTKATGTTTARQVRLDPGPRPQPRVHPGHDWFFVLEGRVELTLGERIVRVEAGEAAEFATMTPHAFVAVDGPAEVIMVVDSDGHRVHRHDGACPPRPTLVQGGAMSGATIIDLVLLLVIAGQGVTAYKIGLVASGLSLVGLLAGAVLGLWLLPLALAAWGPGGRFLQLMLLAVGTVLLASLGQQLGRLLGWRLRS